MAEVKGSLTRHWTRAREARFLSLTKCRSRAASIPTLYRFAGERDEMKGKRPQGTSAWGRLDVPGPPRQTGSRWRERWQARGEPPVGGATRQRQRRGAAMDVERGGVASRKRSGAG